MPRVVRVRSVTPKRERKVLSFILLDHTIPGHLAEFQTFFCLDCTVCLWGGCRVLVGRRLLHVNHGVGFCPRRQGWGGDEHDCVTPVLSLFLARSPLHPVAPPVSYCLTGSHHLPCTQPLKFPCDALPDGNWPPASCKQPVCMGRESVMPCASLPL